MTKNSTKKCQCEQSEKGRCKNCSKVRMAIMLKNGHKQLLNTWYSYYKKNNQQEELIILGMITRFKEQKEYTGAVNQLRFYNNQSNSLIKILKVL